jgi:hypothetical protein
MLAAGSGMVALSAGSDAGDLPVQPLTEEQGSMPKAADTQLAGGQLRAPAAYVGGVTGLDLSQAASAVADVDHLAPPANGPSLQMSGLMSVVGQTPGLDPSAVALAAVGVRLWQGPLVMIEDLSSVRDGAPVAAINTDVEAPATALAAKGTGAVVPLLPSPLGLAETAILSMFAAQAEALVPGSEGGGVGFSLSVTSTTLGGATVGGSVSGVPQLAAQLVHTLSQRSDGMTEIALSPDELGHVRVTLQADAQDPDRMIVMLNFERAETLDLFRRHADQLAEALRDAGYSGVNIGFGQSYGNDSRDRADQPPEPNLTEAKPSLPTAPLGPSDGLPALRLSSSGTLDLRI